MKCADVDVQGIAAIAWRCIRECKAYEGPPVMCPAHQEEAQRLVAPPSQTVGEARAKVCDLALPVMHPANHEAFHRRLDELIQAAVIKRTP